MINSANKEFKAIQSQENKMLASILAHASGIALIVFEFQPLQDQLRNLGLFALPTLNAVLWGTIVGLISTFFNKVVNIWLTNRGANKIARPLWDFRTVLAISIISPVAEEILYRGACQPVLGLIPASAIFALVHLEHFSIANMLFSKLPFGLLLGACLLYTNNIWSAIIAHAINNAYHCGKSYFENSELRNAVEEHLNGKATESLALLNKVIEKKKNAYALRNRAAVHLSLQAFDKALEDATSAIEMHDEFALTIRAQGYAALRRYEEGKRDSERAIKCFPKSAYARRIFGGICLQTGDMEVALQSFEKAFSIEKNAADLINQSAAKIGLFKYAEAIEDANKAVALGFTGSQAYHNRGLAYLQMNELAKSSSEFEEALSRVAENNRIAVLVAKASYFVRIRDHEKGLDTCNQALSIDPKAARAILTRVFCYCLDNRLEDAENDLVSVEKLNLDAVERAFLHYTRALTLLLHKRVDDAQIEINAAINLRPHTPYLMALHAYIASKLGQHNEALNELNAALTLDPFYADAYWYRHKVHEALEHPTEAASDLSQAETFGYKPIF